MSAHPLQRVYGSNQPLRSIAGAAVFITGAGSGMGAAMARLFAAEGAHVAVTDCNEATAAAVAAGITAAGGSAGSWALDVTDAGEIRRVVAAAAADFGGIDCLINNAGFGLPRRIDEPGYEASWERSIAGMLTAIPYAVRAAIPWLRQSPFPRVLNIASTESFVATASMSAYAAAKAGVTGVTRALAVDLGREGITVNCICPGPIDTSLTAGIPDEQKLIYARRRTALRRYGRPEEIAHIALSICLPGASYLTGAAIPVDGGLTIRNS